MSFKYLNNKQIANIILILGNGLAMAYAFAINNTNGILYFGFLFIGVLIHSKRKQKEVHEK